MRVYISSHRIWLVLCVMRVSFVFVIWGFWSWKSRTRIWCLGADWKYFIHTLNFGNEVLVLWFLQFLHSANRSCFLFLKCWCCSLLGSGWPLLDKIKVVGRSNYFLLYVNFGTLHALAREHEGSSTLSVFFSQFFYSVCVSEGVEGVFYTAFGWGYVGNHYCFAFASHEWVFKNLGQLTPSEWCMLLILIKRSNTFFQSEQWFIYLCSVNSSLLSVFLHISASLRPSEIDECELSKLLPIRLFNGDRKHSMRSRGITICSSCPCRSLAQAIVDDWHQFISILARCFYDSHDPYSLFCIFSCLDLFPLV